MNIFQCPKCGQKMEFRNNQPICRRCSYSTIFGDIADLCVEINEEESLPTTSEIYQYVFVFKAPLYKTDLQFKELVSLIKRYARRNSLSAIIKDVTTDDLPIDYFENKTFADCSIEIFVLENSCLVKSIFEIDVKQIVKNSGYVHSAGPCLLALKWEYLKSKEIIIDNIKNYMDESKSKYNLYFYFDSDNPSALKPIKGMLIDYKRTFIGNVLLSREVARIKNELDEYSIKQDFQKEGGSIFIYKDTKKDRSTLPKLYDGQNDQHYMIIYNSLFKKENPVHELDECRPYWHGIYTTPHDLTCAMVNLANIQSGQIIYDPFMHMGTTAIEAAKYDCIILSSDYYEPIGASDNFNFIYSRDIKGIVGKLRELKENKFYEECFKIITDTTTKNEEEVYFDFADINDLMYTYFELRDYNKRLFFYIIRKYKYLELSNNIEDELLDYIDEAIAKFEKFDGIMQKNYSTNSDGWKPEKYLVADAEFFSTRIGPAKNENTEVYFFKANARKMPLRDSSIDAIVTDPPYGYGDDVSNIKELYTDFLRESFRVIKSGGSLVICTLDKIKTGKSTENAMTTNSVINLIQQIIEDNNISLVRKDIIPTSVEKNVNYWKSEHALNRAIISLQILKNQL